MRREWIVLLALLSGALLLLASCKKKDEPHVDAKEKEMVVDATDHTVWKYFSFTKDGLVEVSNFSNDKSWDLAFHRYDFRTNSGESGVGKGGAYITSETDLSASIEKVSDDKFVVDEKSLALMQLSMGGGTGHVMKWEEVPTNTLISVKYKKQDGGFAFTPSGMPIKEKEQTALIKQDLSQMPPVVTLSDKVFLIRCADGSVAKVKVVDYQDSKKVTGHIKFRYVYPAW